MPRVSVWLLRLALIHFASGAVLGFAFLCWKATGWPTFAPSHLGVHQEQMLVGWMVQLVIGTAFWMLPRAASYDASSASRRLWVVFALLNAGVLLAALAGAPSFPSWCLPVGRTAETLAVALFAQHAWHRQRAYRQAARIVLLNS